MRSVAAFLETLAGALFSAHPPAPAPAAAAAASGTTFAALKTAAEAFGDSRVGPALADLVTGRFAGWSDAEPLGAAALAIVAAALPAEAVPLALAAICWREAPVVVSLVGRLTLAPGRPGEGQTAAGAGTHGRWTGR